MNDSDERKRLEASLDKAEDVIGSVETEQHLIGTISADSKRQIETIKNGLEQLDFACDLCKSRGTDHPALGKSEQSRIKALLLRVNELLSNETDSEH